MSAFAWFFLGVYLGGVVFGTALCLAMFDDYTVDARPRLLVCVVLWPLAMVVAMFMSASTAIGRMRTRGDLV